jgi:hypothetical protein
VKFVVPRILTTHSYLSTPDRAFTRLNLRGSPRQAWWRVQVSGHVDAISVICCTTTLTIENWSEVLVLVIKGGNEFTSIDYYLVRNHIALIAMELWRSLIPRPL